MFAIPFFHFDAEIRLLTLMRVRILLLIKVMRICDHWYTVRYRPSVALFFEPPRPLFLASTALHGSIFEPQQLLDFDFDTVRIRLFNFDADPHPIFHYDADPD